MTNITLENLPIAVSQLFEKLEGIETLLKSKGPNQTEDPNKLLNIEEASVILSLAKSTIYALVSRNEIPYMKKGKRLYFTKSELFDYVKEGRKRTIDEIAENAIKNLQSNKKGA
jgi:excisionase family DNA binding protein